MGGPRVTLSAKIREDLDRESELEAQRVGAAAATARMSALLDRPAAGKSRLKANKGARETRVFKTRARALTAKKSRQRNRR